MVHRRLKGLLALLLAVTLMASSVTVYANEGQTAPETETETSGEMEVLAETQEKTESEESAQTTGSSEKPEGEEGSQTTGSSEKVESGEETQTTETKESSESTTEETGEKETATESAESTENTEEETENSTESTEEETEDGTDETETETDEEMESVEETEEVLKAASDITKEQAATWINSQIGRYIDLDGNGYWCVDLIVAYFDFLRVGRIWGNGRDYAYKTPPNGWQAIKGASIQAGDIVIWTGYDYGHVALAVSGSEVVEQRYNTVQCAKNPMLQPGYNRYQNGGYWGVWRPHFKSSGYNPIGWVDSLAGGAGSVTVSGWALDMDAPTQPIAIHVYIGDEGHNISLANELRTDVGNAYPGAGNFHGFSKTITTEKTGRQDITVFAINVGEGQNVIIGNGTVTISDRVKGSYMNTGYARTIPDGYYHIASSMGDRWWLTIAGMSNLSGANVELYDYSVRDFDFDEQLFYFQFIDEGGGRGFYRITNKKSGKCLDVVDGSVYMYGTDGEPTNVRQCTDNGSAAQRWAIREIDDGDKGLMYTLQARCSGFFLDLYYAKTESGANISMHMSNNDSPAQLWRLVPYAPSVGQTIANGEYQIVSKLDANKTIGFAGESAYNGVNVEFGSFKGNAKHTFDVKYLGNGYYSITNKIYDLALEVAGNSRNIRANVQLATRGDGDGQKWTIKDCGNGYYHIISRASNLCLDLSGGTTTDGTNIALCKWIQGKEAIEWKFIPCENSKMQVPTPSIADGTEVEPGTKLYFDGHGADEIYFWTVDANGIESGIRKKYSNYESSGIEIPERQTNFYINVCAEKKGYISSDIVRLTYPVKQQAAPPSEDEAKDAAKNINLTALTNVQPKLENVTLPTGWEWVNPNEELKPFAGDWKKRFAVKYYKNNDRSTEPCVTSLPVTVVTVTGVKINGDRCGTLNLQDEGKKTGALLLEWVVSNTGFNISEYLANYADKVTSAWTSSDNKVATVSNDGAVTAVKEGSATITLNAEIKNPADPAKPYKYKATYGVKVVNGTVATVDVADDEITGFALQDGTYYGGVSVKTAALTVNVTNATSLSVKSSDTSVIAVGKIKGTADTKAKTYSGEIQLAVKAAGSADITLTANDAAKTSRKMTLYVTDPTPSISSDVVTVNLMQTGGTVFYLYPHDGYSGLQVDGVVYSKGGAAAPFTVETVGGVGCGWAIKPRAGVVKNTTHKLDIKGKAANNNTDFTVPLTVKVVDKKPSYKVKQTGKVNLFYKNGRAALNISTNETVKSVTLEKCKFTVGGGAGDYYLEAADGQGSGEWLSKDGKKGTLTIEFEGYGPVSQTFTVATEDRAPSLTLNSKTAKFYQNVRTAATYVMEGRRTADLTGVTFECYRRGNTQTPDSMFTINALGNTDSERGGVLIEIPKSVNFPARSEKAQLVLSLNHKDWNRAVTLAYTADMRVEKPALKLSKTTLRLNANAAFYENAQAKTVLGWKDGAKFNVAENKVMFEANKDTKAAELLADQNVVFMYDDVTKEITARLKSSDIKKGTYKFKAVVTLDNDDAEAGSGSVETPFNLTVANEVLALKLSQTKLTLNTTFHKYDVATTVLGFKNEGTASFLEDEVDVVDANSAAVKLKLNEGVIFEYDKVTRNITARLDRNDVPKGTYKFKVQVPVAEGVTVETPITVQILNDSHDKSVRLSQRGTIDVLNRAGTSVIVTPSVKAINGRVADVELTGDYAHVFDAELDRDSGRVIITAKDDATLITQYDYKVKLVLAIVNGDDQIDYTTPDIRLRLKQGRPRIAVSPVGAVFFSGIETSVERDVAVALSGAKTSPAIDGMELLNNTETFTGEYKEVRDGETEKLVITSKKGAVKGKTYKLKFRVDFEGQADNERPMTVTYTVKVK